MNQSNKNQTIFRISDETAMRLPMITIIGNQRLYIENFRSIIEYSTQQVKILTKKGTFLISGKKLEIIFYDAEELEVQGEILECSFLT